MGKRYLIDTNIIIDAQLKKIPQKGLLFLSEIINYEFNVSFVTYIEFLGFKAATLAMEEFIGLANIIEINKTIINTTIELRKESKIQLPDAIIAATAIRMNLILVTRNTSDFQDINKLKILNLWKIL